MRTVLLVLVGLGLLASGVQAGELKEAKAKFDAAVKEKEVEIAKAPAMFKKELSDELKEYIAIETDNLFELAEKEAESADAFEIFLAMQQRVVDKEKSKKARTLLLTHHLTKPHIKKALPLLAQAGDDSAETHLKKVAEKNVDKECQAVATLLIGVMAQAQAKLTNGQDKKEKLTKATEWLTKAKEKFADVKYQESTIGKLAAGRLAAIKVADSLEVGKPVPDIVGEGIDGKTFKLSDCKGKVVMLSFWATWCGPCMRMVPHERDLVEKMKGRPFELIGVNGDPELTDDVRQIIADKKITWRSFKNEQKDTPPIAETWDIGGWPTIYVIDHKGVIKHIQLGGADLDKFDKLIEELVVAAEKK
ncbi:MAG: TlpA family protein disulfide reductase [Fimbriiglobus sp.]|jgi:thiol-disulfide isomerase/thioredoxin|nr:TlpA family protein disulfide reductase [Fimbriiglobus sp.]